MRSSVQSVRQYDHSPPMLPFPTSNPDQRTSSDEGSCRPKVSCPARRKRHRRRRCTNQYTAVTIAEGVRFGGYLTQERHLPYPLAQFFQGLILKVVLTKRNQLSGDLLKVANALGDGMSCPPLAPHSTPPQLNHKPITHHPAPLSTSSQHPCAQPSRQAYILTGTGFIIRAVCLMYICGLCRIAIMRVGCMAIARVILNILSGWKGVVWSGVESRIRGVALLQESPNVTKDIEPPELRGRPGKCRAANWAGTAGRRGAIEPSPNQLHLVTTHTTPAIEPAPHAQKSRYTATMSDEETETKPFKFVTGMHPPSPPIATSSQHTRAHQLTSPHSRYATLQYPP